MPGGIFRVPDAVLKWLEHSGLRQFGWGRTLIVVKAISAMGIVFFPVWWLHLHFTSKKLPTIPLSLAVSFLGVQLGIIFLQLFASAAVKKLDAIRIARSAHWKSVIEPVLAAQSAGENRMVELRRLRRRRTVDFDACVASMLQSLTGPARESMSRLALGFGVVRRWQRLATKGRMERKQAIEWMTYLSPSVGRVALQPLLESQSIALQATLYRALIRVSRGAEIADLFRRTLRSPFLVRALLAGEFRPYAEQLSVNALPATLACGEEQEIIAALEMVDAWRRVLHLPELETLAHHPNPEIRSLALRAAPVSAVRGSLDQTILGAFEDPDPQVKLAALKAAARLQIRSSLHAVERASFSVDNQVSRLACLVLASFGRDGHSILQYIVVTGDRRVGNWAAEALGQLSAGRGVGADF
jgi:hypothetical protein